MARHTGNLNLRDRAHQHVTAVRVFHTGLLAETQQHLHILKEIGRHIDVLRAKRRCQEKLDAAQACFKELAKLRRLRTPWRETFADLHAHLRRVRALFHRMANARGRASANEPEPSRGSR